MFKNPISEKAARFVILQRHLCLCVLLMFFIGKDVAQNDSILNPLISRDTIDDPAFEALTAMSGAEIESELNAQDASAFLQASKDVMGQMTAYQFSAYRFRQRGYDNKYKLWMINGTPIPKAESGGGYNSLWSGLNDVTRYSENGIAITPNRNGFSGIGGYSQVDAKASSYKKSHRISYGRANRQYANRLMMTYQSGLKKSGWAYAMSASLRQADQLYIPGTFLNAAAIYLSLAKNIGDKQTLGITAFLSAQTEGRTSAEPMEAFALSKDNYYNSNWGLQNGKVRNANVGKRARPMVILNHEIKLKNNARLNTSMHVLTGNEMVSGLNWNNASNPRPDYYRYMPAYYLDKGDSVAASKWKSAWENDVNTRQINWDRMIALNRQNLFVLPGAQNGLVNTNETRARYIMENKIESLQQAGIAVVYNQRIKSCFVSMGFNGLLYRNTKYKRLADLLGADYWLDYDQFAPNLGVDNTVQQNDILHPDKKIKTGDPFGYRYDIRVNTAEAWIQAEYSRGKTDYYFAASVVNKEMYRFGYMVNGKFPNNSAGKSQTVQMMNPSFKTGLIYKLNGRHAILGNAAFIERCPEATQIFISPRSRNDLTNAIAAEKIVSGDLSYQAKFPNLKLRCTVYYTAIENQNFLRTYWHDAYNANINLIMNHVNTTHSGIELGIEKIIKVSHVFQFSFAGGRFVYANRPQLQAWQDNNAMPLFENRTAYLKNYRLGGFPQRVCGIAYRYNDKKHWYIGLNATYVGENYLEPNPDRRTAEAVEKYMNNENNVIQQITAQEKLPNYVCYGFAAGKSFRIKPKRNLNVSVNASNLTFNKNILVGGYEQMRWDPNNINMFGNKYSYLLINTYMVNINYTY